jgi:putative addiction module component (TIGR02574 family)
MPTYETVLTDAIHLSIVDRIQLIEALWDTVPEGEIPPLTPEWLAEIERRSAEFDSGSIRTVPWSDVKASALNRLNAKGT